MAAEIIPIALGLPSGDYNTLWAPSWREDGDDWEAFLGLDDSLYGFPSVATLVAFVRSSAENDLDDHPAWKSTKGLPAFDLEPTDSNSFDLVGVPELLAEKPTEESVTELDDAFALTRALGEVCELDAVNSFFKKNSDLGAVSGGIDNFWGREGGRLWTRVGKAVIKEWDKVLKAIDDIILTPETNEPTVEKAQKELDQAHEEIELATDTTASTVDDEWWIDEIDEDEDPFWARVGIDPVEIHLNDKKWLTLRCYIDDQPVFLGNGKKVFVASSPEALRDFLANDKDHKLSSVSTFDEVTQKVQSDELEFPITQENTYDFHELIEVFRNKPDSEDVARLELAVELLTDVGDYVNSRTVAAALSPRRRLAPLIELIIDAPEEEDTTTSDTSKEFDSSSKAETATTADPSVDSEKDEDDPKPEDQDPKPEDQSDKNSEPVREIKAWQKLEHWLSKTIHEV